MNHMNRLIIVLTLLLSASAALAENYFTMGGNDTLRIAAGSDTVSVPVRAHFDGRVDSWNLTLTWHEGMEGIKVAGGPDMTVPYRDSEGEEHTCVAPITSSENLTTISSIITQIAYWPSPYGGSSLWEGTAMWEAGDYDEMFYLTFKLVEGFAGGTLYIDGLVKGNMYYGGVGQALFYRPVTIVVTRPEGDINGDGSVNIADVTALISQVLSGTTNAAGDLNGDGTVNIADVTALITLVLHHN